MAKENKTKKKVKSFDYKGYVSNLGKVGTFYESGKDSKGIEGTLVSIAENGVYAKVKNSIFPRLFARADFGEEGILKLNGKTYKLVETKNSGSKGKGKGKGKNQDSGSYGTFSGNGGKKANAMYNFINFVDGMDTDDDDECEKIVEKFKTTLKAFK